MTEQIDRQEMEDRKKSIECFGIGVALIAAVIALWRHFALPPEYEHHLWMTGRKYEVMWRETLPYVLAYPMLVAALWSFDTSFYYAIGDSLMRKIVNSRLGKIFPKLRLSSVNGLTVLIAMGVWQFVGFIIPTQHIEPTPVPEKTITMWEALGKIGSIVPIFGKSGDEGDVKAD